MSAFRFKRFTLNHDKSTMKIGTDAVLLAAFADAAAETSVLDIGCGCGVVAFCVAQQLVLQGLSPEVYGIDPDADSIAEAQANAAAFPLLPADHFHFIPEKIQEFSVTTSFDLIVSNPPFFNDSLKPTAAGRLRSRHRDFQLPFEELLQNVCRLLDKNGRFVLILPAAESQEFDKLAAPHLCCLHRTLVQPTCRKPVYRVIQTYGHHPASRTYTERHLVIRDQQNQYTEAYLQAMEPYLL
jgi:tRNA1Val (adenine37-N6)-methyltransferase